MFKGIEQLRQDIKDFFGRLYLEEFEWRPRLRGIIFRTLGGRNREVLEVCTVTRIKRRDLMVLV